MPPNPRRRQIDILTAVTTMLRKTGRKIERDNLRRSQLDPYELTYQVYEEIERQLRWTVPFNRLSPSYRIEQRFETRLIPNVSFRGGAHIPDALIFEFGSGAPLLRGNRYALHINFRGNIPMVEFLTVWYASPEGRRAYIWTALPPQNATMKLSQLDWSRTDVHDMSHETELPLRHWHDCLNFWNPLWTYFSMDYDRNTNSSNSNNNNIRIRRRAGRTEQ